MKLVWVTDPHFDILHPNAPELFGAEASPLGEALVVTGDIAKAPSLRATLRGLEKGFKKPVYFVLGNHDFYRGSFQTVPLIAQKFRGWLNNTAFPLTKNTVLVGTGGWYDTRLGNPRRLEMEDHHLIREFQDRSIDDIIEISRQRADTEAAVTKERLIEGAKQFKHILFATHIPPFPPEKRDLVWDPWFVNVAMGRVLADVAAEYPETRFTVLCGHRHRPWTYQHSHNLLMFQGEADYYNPQVTRVFVVT